MNKKVLIIIGIIIVIAVILIYNKSYVDNYNFKLNGSETIYLNIGDKWDDPGYIVDNDKNIIVNNNIDYSKVGNYQVTYNLKIFLFSKTLTRNVNIVNENQATNFTLSIKGDNPYYLMKDNTYEEPGIYSHDEIDGDLSSKVQVTNNINNTIDGTYEIKYQIKNTNGITKIVSRKVIVYSLNFKGKLKTNEPSQTNDILLKINDSNYSHTILPDGSKSNERNITFNVNENKKYSFIIYDINNNSINYDIDVKNIDNEKPTGTCILSLLDTSGEVTVDAKDNNEIQGFIYQYGNNKTELMTSNKYTIKTMDNTASVTIYDTANNTNTINCKSIDNATKLKRSYTLETYKYNGTNKKYWFYQPKISKRDKVPLVIYFHGAGGGGNVNNVNNIAIPKNLKDGKDFPYYVVAPHNGTQEDFVLSLIDYLVKNYNIDTSRIVLSGGSMGSPPAIRIAGNNPHKFSCVVIISSYSETPNVSIDQAKQVPIWFFQGTADMYSKVENYVKKINDAGGNAKLTSYKGGHDAPVDAFLREDLTNWILNNKAK